MHSVLACQVKGDGSNPVSIILFFFCFFLVTFDFQVNYSFCIFVVGRLDQPNYIFSFFSLVGLGFIIRVRVRVSVRVRVRVSVRGFSIRVSVMV